MALTEEQITAQNFKDFYSQIRPYLNGSAHGGFTPVGTVISVMGKTAPLNYLACNGQVVNIADYPELATYFNVQFGSPNYFGGDGITTFGIPDLRGEFLRGSDSITLPGVHTDEGLPEIEGEFTILANGAVGSRLAVDNQTGAFQAQSVSGGRDAYTTNNNTNPYSKATFKASRSSSVYGSSEHVTPTNTSVLYCIATKNIFMDAGSNYSTEEQVVGTWIDGKPVYQKTYQLSNMECGAGSYTTVISSSQDAGIANIKDIFSSVVGGMPMCTYPERCKTNSGNLQLMFKTSTGLATTNYLTITYTKTTD